MPWQIEQYQRPRGDLPVDEFVTALSPAERVSVLRAVDMLAQFGPQLAAPHAKPIVSGGRRLWELRPGPNRVFYCARHGDAYVLLHAFRKRSQRTSTRDLATAERRYDEIMEGAATVPFGAGS